MFHLVDTLVENPQIQPVIYDPLCRIFLIATCFHLSPSSLSISLPVTLSLPLSYFLPVFIIPISFSIFSYAPQSKQPNKIKQEHYGLPHVLFLIEPVFETVIHLAFIFHSLSFTFKSNFSSK
jgi:hypothetical protein